MKRLIVDFDPSWPDVEAVFAAVGIRIASHEEPKIAVVDSSGTMLGALVAGPAGGAIGFSVAVLPEFQRTGVGRMLVRALIQDIGDAVALTALVVNPNMRVLLEAEGFDIETAEYNRAWLARREPG